MVDFWEKISSLFPTSTAHLLLSQALVGKGYRIRLISTLLAESAEFPSTYPQLYTHLIHKKGKS
jgi:hypothetical protein